jgi:Zn-finger protein
MKLAKGQTRICKKCRSEMSWIELESGKKVYTCSECGTVSKERRK